MSGTDLNTDLDIRSYQPSDEPAVLRLLIDSLGQGPGGHRSPEFFRWKHLENPFGPSLLLVAELEGRIVGLRAFLRWRLAFGDEVLRAARAVDTVTDPEYQGRGIFSKLTLRAVEILKGEADLIFNTPNSKSLPGYLKMGWRTVGQVPIWIRVRRPVSFAMGLRSAFSMTTRPRRELTVDAPAAADVLGDGPRLRSFLEEAGSPGERLATPLTADYLAWRYARAPLGYRAIVDEDARGIRGIAIFRVRPRGRLWETTIAEVLVRPDDRRAAARLLDLACRCAPVDHAVCHFPPASPQLAAARRYGFIRSPKGEVLTVNPLRPDLADVCSDLRSWAVSLGTLEVF
jgi:GNAT superfamily N-acetyltransferase